MLQIRKTTHHSQVIKPYEKARLRRPKGLNAWEAQQTARRLFRAR